MIKFLIVIFIALLGYSYYQPTHKSVSTGTLSINNSPIQERVKSSTLKKRGYTVTTRYSYALKARILGIRRYTSGTKSILSTMDMALGWQEMSKPEIYKYFRITQKDRRFFWMYYSDKPPIPQREVKRKSANANLIPYNREVQTELERASVGDIITMKGFLVDVKKGTFEWNTSTSRSDVGEESPEIFLVRHAKVTKPNPDK